MWRICEPVYQNLDNLLILTRILCYNYKSILQVVYFCYKLTAMIFGNAWVPTQNLFYHLGLKMVVFVLPTETVILDSLTFCTNHEYLQLSPLSIH
jgi:hypothetical protein